MIHKAPIIFKGIEIEPLTYSRRALMASVIDIQNMTFIDIAATLYCAICPRKELIAAKSNKDKFYEAVSDWIDKVEFGPESMEEANKVMNQLIGDSRENEVEPIPADFEQDPDADGLGKR